jgi:hypothetical protein
MPKIRAATNELEYAVPAARNATRVWAAICISIVGLGLVLLGGCFLVGVMMLQTGINPGFPSFGPKSSPNEFLLVVLYTMAFACFAGALGLLASSVRSLLAIARNV